MKKLISLLVTLALVMSIGAVSAAAQEGSGLKLGLAIDTTYARSKDASADAAGLAQADSVAVAVLVDADGKIVNVYIDNVQVKMPFTAEGKLGEDFPADAKTKLELGDDYGMRAASPIGKEWNEQANALAAYTLGKTAAEIDGIALDASTKPTGADLVASVTMSVGDLKAAVLKAIANAK